jgi:hypothetical protein
LLNEEDELKKNLDISWNDADDRHPFFLEKNILYYTDVDWPRKYTHRYIGEFKQVKEKERERKSVSSHSYTYTDTLKKKKLKV